MRGIDVDLARVRIENDYPEAKAAYDLLAKADTVGVFQLESTGMRKAIADINTHLAHKEKELLSV